MISRVFITGGTGLLGRAIVERLVQDGRPVTALARSQDSARSLRALGARPVPGDLGDPDSLVDGMQGCETVYHVAGVNAFCLPDNSVLYRVNVEGSRNVVRAAARSGVRRIVYTSSAATLGEKRGTVGREDSPHRGWFLSGYERSKHQAEQAVLTEAGAVEGLEVVCVNPASVQGPGRTGGTARLLLDYVNGRLNGIPDTRMSLVDIADCTAGHVLAEATGRPAERYVLSGATLTTREAVSLLAGVSGVQYRPRTLPHVLVQAGGALGEAVARIRGRRPRICREMVRTLLHGHAYDGSKATRELGLRYTPIEETLRRTLVWYREHGLVSRPMPGLDDVPGSRDR